MPLPRSKLAIREFDISEFESHIARDPLVAAGEIPGRTSVISELTWLGKPQSDAWTKTDVRELKTLARVKTPARKIARALKRTEGATRQKAFSLGVSLDSRS